MKLLAIIAVLSSVSSVSSSSSVVGAELTPPASLEGGDVTTPGRKLKRVDHTGRRAKLASRIGGGADGATAMDIVSGRVGGAGEKGKLLRRRLEDGD